MDLLGTGGRLVMYGSSSGTLTELSAGDLYRLGCQRCYRRAHPPTAGGLRDLETGALQAVAEHRLVPVIGQRYSLANAPAAHRAIESRSTTGKTVLRP